MIKPEGGVADPDAVENGKADGTNGGIVDELTWLGRGFFQPLYDLRFYRIRSEYGPVLTVGIYALVPAIYVSFLLGQIGISFCGFQSGLLLVIWVIVARLTLKTNAAGGAPAQLPETQAD